MVELSTSDCSIPSFMQKKDCHGYKFKLTANSVKIPIPCLKDKYVAAIPNAFSEEECKELINFSESLGYKDALVNLGFGHTETIKKFRNHKKLTVDNMAIADYILNRIKSVIPNEFNNRRIVDINERLRFLRYSPGEYFGPHYDGMYMRNNGQRSLITILIYLNDNYEGGEITFLHPTNENKTFWIKPQTGMVLLFEQKEVFHQGSVVSNNINNYKYCVRSDIMYSKQLINESKSNDEDTFQSYEVEKQTVYFQRKQPQAMKSMKSSESQPNMDKKSKINNYKLSEPSLTVKVIDFWFIEQFEMNNDERIFPYELCELIRKYCRIIGLLDFLCDPNELETLARTSETAERYEEMMEVMSQFVKIKSRSFKCTHTHTHIDTDINQDQHCEILTMEQRNLLSVAFKNVVGAKRASWRTINGINADIDPLSGEKSEKIKLFVCSEYVRVIERELHETCSQLLDLLENYIINKIKHCTIHKSESVVFYLKMAGDYNRYLAEFYETTIYKEKANEYYCEALKIGKETLQCTNPTLLGLSLNYSVYLYEIAKEGDKACHIGKTAFDNAIEKLDTLNDHTYKDSTLIMRLLRDNLTLWTSTNNDDDAINN